MCEGRKTRDAVGRIRGTRRATSPGFTLVELLVVVSIIALLISILLPSLRKAREQAKQVKCMAHLNGIAKGNSTYGSEWNGWFVGSPITTGQQLYPKSGGGWADDEVNIPGDVVQIWDWAGPIAAQTTDLHWHRAERWRTALLTGIFECPANNFITEPFPNSTTGTPEYDGFGPQRMVSYNTMRAMMTYAERGSDRRYYHPQIASTIYEEQGGHPLPNHAPRIDRIGNPSEKIFLSDGSRYTTTSRTPPAGRIDYSYAWDGSAGGAFSNTAPTDHPLYLTGYQLSSQNPQFAKYTYRHPNGSILGLAAVYFDGHGEWMSEKQSRWPDPWWPKGTKLPWSGMNPDTVDLTVSHWVDGVWYIVRR